MPRTRRQTSLGKLLIGYLGIVAMLIYMALAPGLWKLAVFGGGLAVLGYMAVFHGYDSRDGKDWKR